MVYTKQCRFSEAEMQRIAGVSNTEDCIHMDFYYDKIHKEWVSNAVCVSAKEIITTLFPALAIKE